MNKLQLKTLEPAREQMMKMGFSPERFEKEALHAVNIWNDPKNGYLRKADANSLTLALVNVAQTSLTLNPIAKEAFLIPRYDRTHKIIRITLEPSYVGLVKLLTDAGSVTSINTQLVYQEDEFSIDLAADQPVRHIPKLKDRGEIWGAYSIAKLATGEKQVEWMDVEEIHKIRDTSESFKAWKDDNTKQTIWNTYYGEMCRKTVLKRIYKYLPRTDRMERFDKAVSLTNQDWEPSLSQVSYAESLINSANLIEPNKERLLRELATCDADGVSMMIEYLKDHQPEPGTEKDLNSMDEVNQAIGNAVDRDKDPELLKKSKETLSK